MLGAVISLCDNTGNMARPWAEAGYECWAVDIQHSIRKDQSEQVGRGAIHYVWGDVRTYRRPTKVAPSFVIVQTPCTHTAVSGARDFAKKGGMMLRDALEMFEAGRQIADWSGAPWCQEQPVTMLSSVPHIGKPDHYFHPWQYAGFCEADNYTKKTCIWGGNGFVMPETKRIPPTEGSRMHKLPPSSDLANLRSATAKGFARAVFEANRGFAFSA